MDDEDKQMHKNADEVCSICLSGFGGQLIGTPESCDHNFCLEHIVQWAKKVRTCPFDRQVFNLILVREHLNGKVINRVSVNSLSSNTVYPSLVEFSHEDASDEEDLTYCQVCNECNHEEEMLLCDGCDAGYHMQCLTPPLLSVPRDDWFCPDCQSREIARTDFVSQSTVMEEVSQEELATLLDEAGTDRLLPRLRQSVRQTRVRHRRPIARTQLSERIRRQAMANTQSRTGPRRHAINSRLRDGIAVSAPTRRRISSRRRRSSIQTRTSAVDSLTTGELKSDLFSSLSQIVSNQNISAFSTQKQQSNVDIQPVNNAQLGHMKINSASDLPSESVEYRSSTLASPQSPSSCECLFESPRPSGASVAVAAVSSHDQHSVDGDGGLSLASIVMSVASQVTGPTSEVSCESAGPSRTQQSLAAQINVLDMLMKARELTSLRHVVQHDGTRQSDAGSADPSVVGLSTGYMNSSNRKSSHLSNSKAKAEEYILKLNRQERVVEEVKLVLKPYFRNRTVDKIQYKEILRKCVPKICHSRSGVINPTRVRLLVDGYVKKITYGRKHT